MIVLPPRTSWLYRFGISLSPMRRYLLTFIVFAVLGAVWFFYVYEPMQKRIYNAQKKSSITQSQTLEELRESIASLRAELAHQPSSPSQDDQVHIILGYADAANLTLEHCAVEEKEVMLQAIGTFKQIQGFFDQLSTSGQRLVPRDIRITRGADNRFTLWVIIETK